MANNYVLDPELSLTGNCTIAPPDTAADPGCPEGKHPPKPLNSPRSVVTDSHGDIYVASYGKETENGKEGRIDVFSAEGIFLTELAEKEGPKDLAVDSEGDLYVYNAHSGGGNELRRYEPTSYEPLTGEIEYSKAPAIVATAGFLNSIAINPANDHVFLKRGSAIEEYGSALEGNPLIDSSIGSGHLSSSNGEGLAIDKAHNRIYAGNNGTIQVFALNSPHTLLDTIEGSNVPGGVITGFASLAADETTGKFFIFDGTAKKKVFEFEFDEAAEEGKYLTTIQVEGKDGEFASIFGSEISVDNGPLSPHSGSDPELEAGYLFVPSEEGVGQSLAFAPSMGEPPVVESVSVANVTEKDAELRATINPGGLETHYTFEYTTQERFEAEEFQNAANARKGNIPAGKVGVKVSASAVDLSPETTYRFRVVAENVCEPEKVCKEGAIGSFATYPEEEVIAPCPNEATRTGLSALLPDCRAYELVTPPDTNARTPRGPGALAGTYFPGRESSPLGGKVSFTIEGGILPGDEGTGSILGDPYLSTRGPDGWSTESAGPNGVEALTPMVGSTSPDQGYSFWTTNGPGSASIEEKSTAYVRYPDGHSALVGRGSIAADLGAEGQLVSENGTHILFSSLNTSTHEAVQLEPNASPGGTEAIYDRTSNEVTHVVSLLPGNVTPSAGQNAQYAGASLDGRGVAFKIGKKLYLRFNNEETYEVGEGVTFAGVAEGGVRIFYLKGGDLFAFDAQAEETIRFSESGNVTPVNVAAEGAAAYFVSPSVLTGVEDNPNGDTAQPGKENLYLSREGAVSFVATVIEQDIKGGGGSAGLGLWVNAANTGRFGEDASRSTPDGSVLLFESRAPLAGYDPEGHSEIYRYASDEDTLQCLSCNPTQAAAESNASLQSILLAVNDPEPLNPFVLVNNLRDDGRRAFFQSAEPLVVNDTDGLQDVYEWEAHEVGGCKLESGCIYLISSGLSHRADYLYAVSDSGDDIFFQSADQLLSSDTESTPSIYDARVEGGFLTEPECTDPVFCSQKLPPPPPSLTAPTSPVLGQSGNLPPKPSGKSCPKGKHKVTRDGKTRCVEKKHKRRHQKAGSSKRKGAGK